MAVVSSPNAPSSYPAYQTIESLAFAPFAQGGVVNAYVATIDFNDTTAKTLFTLPKGAIVKQVQVDVTTAFDAGTTNVIDVGIGADADGLANDVAAGSIARVLPVQNVPTLTPLTGATDVTATYVPSGTAATAGEATIWVSFVVLVSA